jgi:hypothetical protein
VYPISEGKTADDADGADKEPVGQARYRLAVVAQRSAGKPFSSVSSAKSAVSTTEFGIKA